jgi:P63C domain
MHIGDVMVSAVTGRAKGGVARAAKLTSAERREIAQKAAAARWAKDIPYATHEGTIRIHETEIPCAVLNTGQRVVTQSGFMRALGRARQAKGRHYYKGDVNLPAFLTAQNLKPFISNVLEVTSSQIIFRPKTGGRPAFGYADELLPEVCDVFIKADRANVLRDSQKHIADAAHIIMKGLAHVGIAGLIDEATGYQEVRDKHALQAILDAFLRKELAAWAKRFPDEFYFHIARLRGWEWKGRKFNPPQIVAHYTNDFVYHRLAPHLVEELEKRNPIVEGRRRAKHTQWLTEDVGHPALAQHLHAVIALMRASQAWDQFRFMLDAAFPKQEETLKLPIFKDQKISMAEKETEKPVSDLPLLRFLETNTAHGA